MFTYYFLQDGEVAFIENFDTVTEAIDYKKEKFPKATLAVRIKEED